MTNLKNPCAIDKIHPYSSENNDSHRKIKRKTCIRFEGIKGQDEGSYGGKQRNNANRKRIP